MLGVKRDSGLYALVRETGQAAVHVLEAGQKDLAADFFRPTREEGGRLNGPPYRLDNTGLPNPHGGPVVLHRRGPRLEPYLAGRSAQSPVNTSRYLRVRIHAPTRAIRQPLEPNTRLPRSGAPGRGQRGMASGSAPGCCRPRAPGRLPEDADRQRTHERAWPARIARGRGRRVPPRAERFARGTALRRGYPSREPRLAAPERRRSS